MTLHSGKIARTNGQPAQTSKTSIQFRNFHFGYVYYSLRQKLALYDLDDIMQLCH